MGILYCSYLAGAVTYVILTKRCIKVVASVTAVQLLVLNCDFGKLAHAHHLDGYRIVITSDHCLFNNV